ncbi:hypothetical protein JCGZ_18209 [Jatropha curcas]|uniref:Aminotransferase-like plant mobile domain-containing protein n=1 Tax=Jatropha curcas TaxID=180498 RepID=A0A067K217_JATCU|nr:hypothetical protein JCGZ_18209 [Jatropha curcas]
MNFLTQVDLGKARAGRSSTDASAFWDLLDPSMRSRVIFTGFGDYAAGLRRTQPRVPPAMRYALMERRNDCTHSFIFGFGEMTLTLADYTAITRLGFDGEVAPLDARYQTTALGAELVRTLLRLKAPAYTREERDQAVRSFIFYIISSQLLCTSQNKGDRAVLACLRDLSVVGSYDWASLALAHLYHGLDVWTRGSVTLTFLQCQCRTANSPAGPKAILKVHRKYVNMVWAYESRIYPGGLDSDTSTEARRIPWYLAHRHHTFSSSEDPHYWRCYLNDRALADLLLTPWVGDSWAAYPPGALAEALTRSKVLLQGY